VEGVAVTPGFWRRKRVLLTGHTGFKGSWLSLWLQALQADLTGYALAPPEGSALFELAGIGRGMRSVIGDIRDESAVRRVMAECRPEIVIHMAAQPLVRYSYEHPVETYGVNVMGTVNLLEAVRHCPEVRAVVNVTTDKCYENREWLWPYRENEPMGGHDPYSSSKGCSELVSAAYRASYFGPSSAHPVALATARAGNVIGGGDWACDRLVPDVIRAFERGEPALIRQPHAVRPWQHVLEPLRGYLQLAERLHDVGEPFAQAWNFGPLDQDACTVSSVAQQFAACWGGGARVQTRADERGHEASYLRLDISKAGALLDWRPALRLSQAVGLTVDWAKQRGAGADVRVLTLAQIQAYQASAAQVPVPQQAMQ
jgi:CDP-glucose 4,6-dehydratase